VEDVKIPSLPIAYKIVCGNNNGHTNWQDSSKIKLPAHCARFLFPEHTSKPEEREVSVMLELCAKTSTTHMRGIEMTVSLDQNPLPSELYNKLKKISNSKSLDAIDRRLAIRDALVDWKADPTCSDGNSSLLVPLDETNATCPAKARPIRTEPEEVLLALEREGWPGKATYHIEKAVEIMKSQSYECHDDARRFLEIYSGLTIDVCALPSRHIYRCRFGWQTDFMIATDIMRIQSRILAYPIMLCPVGKINGKTLLMTPRSTGTTDDEGDTCIPTLFFVGKAGGKKLGLVGDNIVTVLSSFARDCSAKDLRLPPQFKKEAQTKSL
jgi:hypothetical protein